MRINLLLHPISAKILMCRHGIEAGVIRLVRSDLTTTALMIDWSKWSSRDQISMDDMTHQIILDTSDAIVDHITGNESFLAKELYRRHKEELMNFVWGQQVSPSATAKEGIHRFYNRYGLTDDDLNLESIYREWSRWKEKKNKKLQNLSINTAATEVVNCKESANNNRSGISTKLGSKKTLQKLSIISKTNTPQDCQFSAEGIKATTADIILSSFVRDNLSQFLTNRTEMWLKHMHTNLIIYTYYHYCAINADAIAKILNIAIRMVYYRIHKWERIMWSNPKLREDYENRFENIKMN